jgi:phosphoserine aminotransferase
MTDAVADGGHAGALRRFSFSSGPAILPEAVLREAQAELLDWGGRGYSVIETSHRAEDFVALQHETVALLRELLAVPPHYRILLLQGGGHLQFSMVPLNLLGARSQADYVISGVWAEKAAEEARRFCAVRIAGTNVPDDYLRLPDESDLQFDPRSAYVYLCSNETINGLEFGYVPDTGAIPLVADMSSSFLSQPVDVSRYGLIYACAQKNFGLAGLVVVVIREDLIGQCSPRWPTMLDYKTHADADSSYNTPPTFAVYLAALVLRWIKAQGGLAEMRQRREQRAGLLYDTIDGSGGFYTNRIRRQDRSRMNVPFSLQDPRRDAAFLAGAAARGLLQLKGHRLVGGMRASIYNAMPVAAVRSLVDYMGEFRQRHG